MNIRKNRKMKKENLKSKINEIRKEPKSSALGFDYFFINAGSANAALCISGV